LVMGTRCSAMLLSGTCKLVVWSFSPERHTALDHNSRIVARLEVKHVCCVLLLHPGDDGERKVLGGNLTVVIVAKLLH
jgi:hypothetical protein